MQRLLIRLRMLSEIIHRIIRTRLICPQDRSKVLPGGGVFDKPHPLRIAITDFTPDEVLHEFIVPHMPYPQHQIMQGVHVEPIAPDLDHAIKHLQHHRRVIGFHEFENFVPVMTRLRVAQVLVNFQIAAHFALLKKGFKQQVDETPIIAPHRDLGPPNEESAFAFRGDEQFRRIEDIVTGRSDCAVQLPARNRHRHTVPYCCR